MVQIYEDAPSFGQLMGRGLGQNMAAFAGGALQEYQDKQTAKKFKEQFGFDLPAGGRQEFYKSLGKGLGAQPAEEAKMARRMKMLNEMRGSSSIPERDLEKEFLESLPQIEQALGRELTPEDLDALWTDMQEHAKSNPMSSQRQEEDPFRLAEEYAIMDEPELSRVATQRAKEQTKAQATGRAESNKLAAPTLDRGRTLLEEIPYKENALMGMKEAIASGNLSTFTLDNLAEMTGIEGFRSPEGAEFKTLAKEFYLGNLKRIGAKGLNQMMERVVMEMAPVIGRSTEANLAVSEILDAETDVTRKEAELIHEIGQKYKDKHGHFPEDLQYRVYKELRPYAQQRQKDALNNIDKIKEKYTKKNKEGVLMRDPSGNLRRVPHKDRKNALKEGYSVA